MKTNVDTPFAKLPPEAESTSKSEFETLLRVQWLAELSPGMGAFTPAQALGLIVEDKIEEYCDARQTETEANYRLEMPGAFSVDQLTNEQAKKEQAQTIMQRTRFWDRAATVGATKHEWEMRAPELNEILKDRAEKDWRFGGLRADNLIRALVKVEDTRSTKSHLSIPFTTEAAHEPYPSPRRFLYDFGKWIIASTDEASAKLEALNRTADLVTEKGLYAAQRANIGPGKSPFRNNSVGDEERGLLEEFFEFHLEKSRLEYLLSCRSFIQRMTLASVPREEFFTHHVEQFDVLFETFREDKGLQEIWDKSGLSLDCLFEFFEQVGSETDE